jgi:hypothetical protein
VWAWETRGSTRIEEIEQGNSSETMKLIVEAPHVPESEDDISLSVGDRVQIKVVSTEKQHWMGPVFCTFPDGRTCWTSHRFFAKIDDQAGHDFFKETESSQGTVGHQFNSRELKVELGDSLEGFGTSGKGWWCANARGESGWVPIDCVDIDEPDLKRRRIDLIAEIESAFSEVEKGAGIGLREALQRDITFEDTPESHQLILDARAQDIERWQGLSDEILLGAFGDALFFTDQVGFRYLIPAYMRYCLQEKPIHHDLAEHVILRILGGFPVEILEINLSFDQRRAISHYCEYMLDMEITSASLDKTLQRELTHELFESVNENLNSNWFSAPW